MIFNGVNMSSKKKTRWEKYFDRQKKRDAKKKKSEEAKRIMREGTPEEIAVVMGIKLK